MKQSAGDCAAARLSRRDMSEAETRDYLKGKGYSDEEIRGAISMLKEYRYLDDRRYALQFLRYAERKNWAKRRAFAELNKRGVDAETADNAFEDYEEEFGEVYDEYKMAQEETVKVLRLADLGEDDPVSEKVRGRIARRLAARGFSQPVVYDVLDRLRRTDEWQR